MKKDYTEDEYKSLLDMTSDEAVGRPAAAPHVGAKHAVSRSEYEQRKKAKEEGLEDSKRASGIIIVSSVVILVVCIIIAAIAVAIKVKSAKNDVEQKAINVINVAGEEISADLFTMFCVTFMEGSEFETVMKTTRGDEELCNAVKKHAVSYVEEYVCLYKEAEKAGITVTEEGLNNIRKQCEAVARAAGSDAEEYYRANYGVSLDTYVEVRANWLRADKYLSKLRGECDTSEASLKKVYDENYSQFAKADVTMIYFDISTNDEGANGFKESSAKAVFDEIKIADNINYFKVDEAKFSEAIKAQKDKNEFYEIGDNADGKTTVSGAHQKEFSELYESVIKMTPGELRFIKDKSAIFIVRCDSVYLFDSVKNSEELKTLAQELYITSTYESVRHSGEYDAELLSEYRSLDIENYVLEAVEVTGK